MSTENQAFAHSLLAERESSYQMACASLAAPGLNAAQRNTRQENVARALRALNYVRVAAGLSELAGPPLLTLDGLLEQQRHSLSFVQAA